MQSLTGNSEEAHVVHGIITRNARTLKQAEEGGCFRCQPPQRRTMPDAQAPDTSSAVFSGCLAQQCPRQQHLTQNSWDLSDVIFQSQEEYVKACQGLLFAVLLLHFSMGTWTHRVAAWILNCLKELIRLYKGSSKSLRHLKLAGMLC